MNEAHATHEKLDDVKRTWEHLATVDPLWAILSVPEKQHGRWDLEEFFRTGEREIETVLGWASRHERPEEWRTAVDFGCGVGRLSQALCSRFAAVSGIDIAPRMIALAREFNKHGERCTYIENDSDGLPMMADNSIDFVYSSLVLQHLRPRLSAQYAREFIRIMAPGGLAAFQLPTIPRAWAQTVGRCAATIGAEENALPMTAGETAVVTVYARNDGDSVWPGTVSARYPGVVGVGNHWLRESGEMMVFDDGRAHFTEDVEPGERRSVEVRVTAPTEAGDYLLEFDVVQEGVAWFAQRGGSTLRLHSRVSGGTASASSASAPPEGGTATAQGDERPEPTSTEAMIEMYGVPRPWLEELVVAAGGVLVEAIPVDWAGEFLESYLYLVTK